MRVLRVMALMNIVSALTRFVAAVWFGYRPAEWWFYGDYFLTSAFVSALWFDFLGRER